MKQTIKSHSRLPLRRQIGVLALSIVLLMLSTGMVSILLVTRSIHTMQRILNNNQLSYNLQQAVAAEAHTFRLLIQSPGKEARQAFDAAAEETARCLEQIPFDYTLVGEARYEITWTIRSSYKTYCSRRDAVLAMDSAADGYIDALYDVYTIQEYLLQYCGKLTARVLQASNDTYNTESSRGVQLPALIIGILLAVTIQLLVALYSTMGDLFRGLGQLARVSRNIEQNNFSDPDLIWESDDEMGQMVRAFNKMKHATQENRTMEARLHRDELERIDLEKRFSAAQFQALKNQLNPHFLFNTLNTIARMAKIEGAATSEQMIVAVSNLLRYNLRTNDPLVLLSQELKVVEDYIYIQHMRFGNRVRYRLDCQADTSAKVPVFLLQPLVENAIQHGLSRKENGGSICICIRRVQDRLRVAVTDTGCGMTPEQITLVRQAMVVGDNAKGIGLCNLGRRISGMYTDGRVQVYSKAGCGTAVIMEFGSLKEL